MQLQVGGNSQAAAVLQLTKLFIFITSATYIKSYQSTFIVLNICNNQFDLVSIYTQIHLYLLLANCGMYYIPNQVGFWAIPSMTFYRTCSNKELPCHQL